MWTDKFDGAQKENEESLGKIQNKIANTEEQIQTMKTRINNIRSQIQKNEIQMKKILKNYSDWLINGWGLKGADNS